MSWKKHTMKAPDIHKKNREFNKKLEEKVDELVAELANTDQAIDLEYLEDYFVLSEDDNQAIQELAHILTVHGKYSHKVVPFHENKQVFIQFYTKEEDEEEDKD
ncbi:MAG: hypothetical protein GF411_00085 [Candidatus Lokiarchaeota archaeon]|nr:hypothetical protein [Candidatus Lokiarchaeota archaeon]